ncbi:hypothetical protein [Chryseobacterium oranimense]|uniref:hypothetical protein n=1 Tax=Chryseobacterium oranimense TaxID=421058 RepID=UPI0031DA91DF
MRNQIINSLSFFIIGVGACLGFYQWYNEGTFSKLSLAIFIVGTLGAIIPLFVKNAYEKEYVINDWDHDADGWFLKITKKKHGISNPTITYYEKYSGVYNVVGCQQIVLDNGDCMVRVNNRANCKIVIS